MPASGKGTRGPDGRGDRVPHGCGRIPRAFHPALDGGELGVRVTPGRGPAGEIAGGGRIPEPGHRLMPRERLLEAAAVLFRAARLRTAARGAASGARDWEKPEGLRRTRAQARRGSSGNGEDLYGISKQKLRRADQEQERKTPSMSGQGTPGRACGTP